MATATYLQGALSVVSSFVIDEFDLSRSQLGAAFTAFTLTGALSGPVMGALTDRDTRRVMAGLFGLSGLAVVMVASAPTFIILLMGSVVGGVALGAANPVTNRVIASELDLTRRGLVVGLKQAGPPVGLFVAGALLPPLALMAGWRWAMGASALIPLAGLVATPFLLRRGGGGESSSSPQLSAEDHDVRRVVIWLTVIGLGAALSLAAVIAFVPLYAQQGVGASPATAGGMAAVLGLTGVGGRILWATAAGRMARPTTALLVISVISILAITAIALAQSAGLWLLWVGVIAAGLSMMAWHAVGWLIVIDRVGPAGVGKASGVMQFGNGIGYASGPLIAGLLIDATDSYLVAWSTIGLVLAVTVLLTLLIRIRTTTPETEIAQ